MTFDAKVLTVSESVSRGTREDRSGEALGESLATHGYRVVERRVVPDGVESVATALGELSSSFAGLVVTTGGTGFSPTDLTPEATRSMIEREAPGLAEAMRAVSPLGRLSRGVAGADRPVSRPQRPRVPQRGGRIVGSGRRRPTPCTRIAGRRSTSLKARTPDADRPPSGTATDALEISQAEGHNCRNDR